MNAARITAQVALEAIVDDPGSWELPTMNAVYDAAVAAGVARMYLELLADAINTQLQAVDA